MPERFTRSSVHLEVTDSEPAHEIPDSDTPFQILVIGDFSGRANLGLHAPLAGRRPVRVDCDNVDETMAQMDAMLHLPSATLHFRELDDFHPDHIYRNVELFRKLEEVRQRPPRKVVPPATPSANLLDQMLEEQTSAPMPAHDGDSLADFIHKVTASHLEQKDPDQQKWSARIDAAAGEEMRSILHHPQFQALEAAWRGVQMLVQRLNPDSELRLYLLDATVRELLAEPRQFAECLAASKEPWAVIAGNFAFGQSEQDAAALRTLGRIAAHAGAPFLAEGQPPSDGDEGSAWNELRKSPEARWIGLALPRFLLRLPYGKATSETESLHFEEMPGSVHAEYLWGNPAFACACLLGEAFRDEGWQLRPGRGQITGLPQHFYKEDGGSVAKPCAEILLTERDAEFLLENGLMPVASMKDQDAILMPRLQSIAEPVRALAGRWSAGR